VTRFLEVADQAAPHCIEALYLLGSAAFDDFQPGRSDLDLVIVTGDPSDPTAARAIQIAHSAIAGSILADGVVLGWDDLQQDPVTVAPRPCFSAGRFRPAGRSMLDPVTWHTIARYAVTMRGPRQSESSMWCDRASLTQWTRGNLSTYWTDWRRSRNSLLSYAGLTALHPRVAEWGVLGVSRLLYTLETGNLTSKTGAGIHALGAMPLEWHPILNECLRLRQGGAGPNLAGNPLARRRQALDYVAEAISHGGRLH
jgi:hypothetical protein